MRGSGPILKPIYGWLAVICFFVGHRRHSHTIRIGGREYIKCDRCGAGEQTGQGTYKAKHLRWSK